ncbi:MAG: hypothetical protein LBT08_06625 [Synergistaceae bacterium]|jgi:hypothetical protein|nr:hypothetical protein [Synergistaceae bacterium]
MKKFFPGKAFVFKALFLLLAGVAVFAAAQTVSVGAVYGAEKEIKEILGNVSGGNILVYDPGEDDPRSKICIVMMYGSTRATDTLPNAGMKRYAELGYRAANCAPQTLTFIDQVKTLDLSIKWIKANVLGVEKVVLWGNSRGCNLTSAFQRIAERPDSFVPNVSGNSKAIDIPASYKTESGRFTPADGIIMCDANHGFMFNVLSSLATDLADDGTGSGPGSVMSRPKTDLNPINQANGYNPDDGSATYTPEFRKKIWKAQAERYNGLLAKAKGRWDAIQQGNGAFSDDEPFTVVMGFGNVSTYQLYTHDISNLYSQTARPQKLLHNDGKITKEVVYSLRGPEKAQSTANMEMMDKCYNIKVSEFMYLAMDVDPETFGYDESEMYGVKGDDFSSAHLNVKYISVPTLASGRTAGTEFHIAEKVYENSIAATKDCIFIEGMTHGGGILGNDPKYSNVVANELNYIDDWLVEVFEINSSEQSSKGGGSGGCSAAGAGIVGLLCAGGLFLVKKKKGE